MVKGSYVCRGKNKHSNGVIITDGNAGDSPQFCPLIKQTSEGFTINEVSADLAYSSKNNLELVNDVGGMPYIPFKKNAVGSARGSSMWKKMYHNFQLNRDEFLKHYHKPLFGRSTFNF